MTAVDTPAVRGCVVCRGSLSGKERAKEDVIPVWLQEHLGIGEAAADPQVIGPESTGGATSPGDNLIVKRRRRHNFRKGLAGEVCKGCNGGWMSQLETEVQPVLKKLIADPLAADFKRSQWETLARWLLKTSYMYEQSNRWTDVFIPHGHILQVRDRQLPQGIALFLSATEPIHANCFQWITQDWATWLGPRVTREAAGAFRLRTYKATLHLRGLIMTMAYVPPEPGWRVSRWTGVHRQVVNTGLKVDVVPSTAPPKRLGSQGPALALLLSCLGRYPVEIVGRTAERQPIYAHEVDVYEMYKKFMPEKPLFSTGGS